MRAWITKYALSKGVFVIDVDGPTGQTQMVRERTNGYPRTFHGDEWHSTRKSAKARAEYMRKNKIASLKKQIARLEIANIDVPK